MITSKKKLRQFDVINAMRNVIGGTSWDKAASEIEITANQLCGHGRQILMMGNHPKRNAGKYPEHFGMGIYEIRKHKDYWLEKLDIMEREFMEESTNA